MNIYLGKTVCLIALIALPNMSLAATKAWIIGSKTAIKLNVKDSLIEKQQSHDIFRGRYSYDKRTGNLFVILGMGRFDTVINVYDIKTFQKKGQLEIEIDNSVSQEAQLLIPNYGNLFYLRWMKTEKSAPEIISYDATTYKPVNKYQTNPPTTKQLMLSKTGDRLYSLVFGGGVLKLDTFQISDFTSISTVDIKQFFTLGTDGGVTDLFAEKALVDEVISRTPQLDYFEYIYDASTNTISQKIRTTLIGSDYLIPMTNKIAFHEEKYAGKYKSMSLKSDYQSSGNIHFFDAVSGKKVATVKVNVAQQGKIIGLTPVEDQLYFVSYGVDFSNPMLHIIDLNKYYVIKTLPLPEASESAIFFEE